MVISSGTRFRIFMKAFAPGHSLFFYVFLFKIIHFPKYGVVAIIRYEDILSRQRTPPKYVIAMNGYIPGK